MDTAVFLRHKRAAIVRDAHDALVLLRERHYESAGADASKQRLDVLFDHLVDAVATRDVSAIVTYAAGVARERFEAAYDLAEVQAAFNTLESATWRCILADLPADNLAEALGLVSTVFGAAKDALGRQYVSLATQVHAPSLDLRALFSGTDGV